MSEALAYTLPLPYPQTKLRITANYPAGPAGLPETVDIELNDDAVPADAAERTAFITHLVTALFRNLPADVAQYNIEIQNAQRDQPDAAVLKGVRGR